MERSVATQVLLGGDRCSILQQIVHDLFTATPNGLMQCVPGICSSCLHQLLSEASVALGCGTLEWSSEQLLPLFSISRPQRGGQTLQPQLLTVLHAYPCLPWRLSVLLSRACRWCCWPHRPRCERAPLSLVLRLFERQRVSLQQHNQSKPRRREDAENKTISKTVVRVFVVC